MLAPWKKSCFQPRQHIKKQRHYFADKGLSSQNYGFSSGHVRMWELDCKESQVPKNWYFCWRRLFRVPAKRSNQSNLKEISPEYSLEGLMLKLQYFGHLMWRTDSLEKTLVLEKIEGRRRRGPQRMRWLDGITDSMDMFEQAPFGDGQETWRAAVHGVAESQTWLSNWTNKLVVLLGCWLIPSWEWDILGKKKVQRGHCHVVPWVLWSLLNLSSYYLSECIYFIFNVQFLLVLFVGAIEKVFLSVPSFQKWRKRSLWFHCWLLVFLFYITFVSALIFILCSSVFIRYEIFKSLIYFFCSKQAVSAVNFPLIYCFKLPSISFGIFFFFFSV